MIILVELPSNTEVPYYPYASFADVSKAFSVIILMYLMFNT